MILIFLKNLFFSPKVPRKRLFDHLKKQYFRLYSTLQGLFIEIKLENFYKTCLPRIGGLKLSPHQDRQFIVEAVLPQDAFPFILPKEKKKLEEEIALSSSIERLYFLWKQL